MGGFLVDSAATVGTKTTKEVRFCRSLETSLLVRSGALGEPLPSRLLLRQTPVRTARRSAPPGALLADQGADEAVEEPVRDRDQLWVTQQEPLEVGTRDQRRRCAGHNR